MAAETSLVSHHSKRCHYGDGLEKNRGCVAGAWGAVSPVSASVVLPNMSPRMGWARDG